ncbi:hypothetical protein [Prosthecobacter sp.]|uniref:hypothetical protein n=1 Tax=Prosthecobacter sp. TaxID=1965333 RepID=UPI0026230D2C|nr:hypothetical protein [Prosthecobacter sp.]
MFQFKPARAHAWEDGVSVQILDKINSVMIGAYPENLLSGLCHRPGMRNGFPDEEFRSFSLRKTDTSPPRNSAQTGA